MHPGAYPPTFAYTNVVTVTASSGNYYLSILPISQVTSAATQAAALQKYGSTSTTAYTPGSGSLTSFVGGYATNSSNAKLLACIEGVICFIASAILLAVLAYGSIATATATLSTAAEESSIKCESCSFTSCSEVACTTNSYFDRIIK